MHPDCPPLPMCQPAPAPQAAPPPCILSLKLGRDMEFITAVTGRERLYVLLPEGGRAKQLPPQTLIYVHLDPAAPGQAAVFEPSTVYHRFLGYAHLIPDTAD